MSIVTDADCEDFLNIEYKGTFTITAANDVLIFTSDQGGPASIDVADGTYEGAGAATALQTAMNASTTLTGSGVITFAVSYSTSTKLFTINAGTGHTIDYTNSGSDGGRTFGFTDDTTAGQTITSDTEVPGDPTSMVTVCHDGAERIVKEYCDRTFESTSYSLEKYDGSGDSYLFLNQYPVTAITRLSIGHIEVVRIKNTATDANNATIAVSSTTLTLTVDGGASAHTDTLTLSAYTTMALLVAAINALSAYSWSATIESSIYNNLKPSDLLELFGSYCGNRSDTGQTEAYLYVPERPETYYEVNANTGMVKLPYPIRAGMNNVIVSYTAGYSSANMPKDLRLAVLILTKWLYDKRNESSYGLKQYSIGHVSAVFPDESIPVDARDILDKYRRVCFV